MSKKRQKMSAGENENLAENTNNNLVIDLDQAESGSSLAEHSTVAETARDKVTSTAAAATVAAPTVTLVAPPAALNSPMQNRPLRGQYRSDERYIRDLERRIERLERKINSNERFARTFTKCVSTQVLASDAILYILRKSLHEDAEIREEITDAIKRYDKRKISRWFSGFFGVLIRIVALAAAAFMGAFIYWVFSGE